MIKQIKKLATMMGVPFRHSLDSALDQCHLLDEMGFEVWSDNLSEINDINRGPVTASEAFLNFDITRSKSEMEIDEWFLENKRLSPTIHNPAKLGGRSMPINELIHCPSIISTM
jgi:hypothetical protein